MEYVGRVLCKNDCSEMMLVWLVLSRSICCYICHARTSLSLVMSQWCCIPDTATKKGSLGHQSTHCICNMMEESEVAKIEKHY
jgi:hypothetical protein